MYVLKFISEAKSANKKKLAILIDPDTDFSITKAILENTKKVDVDIIFVGGSLLYKGRIDECIDFIKAHTNLPIVIFPGSEIQISEKADALLFLSLISGRNPDLLIGKHVTVAPFLKQMGLEVIPTGYMLIEGGNVTTASYISQTIPIPSDKPGVAMATAIAGEFLGLKLIYLDGGSGAKNPVPIDMIRMVSNNVSLPLIVGGGIRNKQSIKDAWNAGADIVVVGNLLESNPDELQGLR
ncbi:MAG: geranylgeranylglyceryl/heptaprenylglyceryl phosphate synthase [Bacteroidetes bacterium]|nr:geranylgeranylglyceryl/heptaprenylglyceryl phosphate synthase [Bacteroidota bacterium]